MIDFNKLIEDNFTSAVIPVQVDYTKEITSIYQKVELLFPEIDSKSWLLNLNNKPKDNYLNLSLRTLYKINGITTNISIFTQYTNKYLRNNCISMTLHTNSFSLKGNISKKYHFNDKEDFKKRLYLAINDID